MSTSERSRAGRSGARSTKTASAKPKPKPAAAEAHVCQEPGCGKVCKSAGGLKSHARQAHPAAEVESPTQAVERTLRSITITPKIAWLAATVRDLAVALEKCEPTDKAKTSKELAARMNDLLGDVPPNPDEPDWTEE